MFCSNIGRCRRIADHAEDRGHVDDRAATCLEHGRDLGAHPVLHAAQIDIDDTAPILGRKLARWQRRAADPCIVERHMKGAELLDRQGDRRFCIFGPRNIAAMRHGARALIAARGGKTLDLLRIHIGDYESDTIGRQQTRRRLAYSRSGARDQRAVALETVSHPMILPWTSIGPAIEPAGHPAYPVNAAISGSMQTARRMPPPILALPQAMPPKA